MRAFGSGLPVVLLVVLVGPGCATLPDAARLEAASPYQPLGRDFFVRQSVLVSGGGEERRFEIVLESRCGVLRLAALTPFGLRLFSAVRDADGLRVDALAGQELPFDPQRVLRDVERSFFRSAPVAGSAERVVVFAGESVEETWRDGRLVERRVRASGQPDDPPLVIRYGGALGPAGISQRVDLSNAGVGYALAIRNIEIEALACERDRGR